MITIIKVLTLILTLFFIIPIGFAYNESIPRPFEVNTGHDIWYAQNASSYITPNNLLVREVANQLFIDIDGRIKYKDIIVPWLTNTNGTVLAWTHKEFNNEYNYSIYNETYGITNTNNLPWLMPDFYLYHGNRGVCSAWANTVTSLMLSGNISILDNGTYIKQVILAKTVLGYTSIGKRDAWSEYQVYNHTWLTTTMMLKIQNENVPGMEWTLREDITMRNVYEFTDQYFIAVR